jgi:hypothetical protein
VNTAQTITRPTPSFAPLTRTANVVLVVILGAAVGLSAAFAIDQLRSPGPGTSASQADGFSTQRYAELSAPQGFSTQDYALLQVAPAAPAAPQGFSTRDYADRHVAPAAPQGFSTQDYAAQHD